MAGHPVIEAYLTGLAHRLPPDTVDELADGLAETYHQHRGAGLDEDAAARAAVAEFGTPDVVVSAFVSQAPGRRAARALLFTGPVVGACWGVALLVGHAWTWPVPVPLRLLFGLVLTAVVGAVAVAATGRRYRPPRLSVAGRCGVIAVDAAMLTVAVLAAPHPALPLAVAAGASVARLALTARSLVPASSS